MIFKNQHGLRRISPAAVELKILAGFMEFVRHLGESGVRVSIILASALERKILGSIATMSEAYGINLLGVVEKPITPGKLEPLIRRHKSTLAQWSRPEQAGPTFSLQLGCGLAQGYFIVKPMEASAYLKWLGGWKQSG